MKTAFARLFPLAGLALLCCSCRTLPPRSPVAPTIARRQADATLGPTKTQAVALNAAPPAVAAPPAAGAVSPAEVQPVSYSPPALPPGAFTGQTTPHRVTAEDGFCQECNPGSECQECPTQQCGPDGLACPWPSDEYLCDGGDRIPDAKVKKDWTVVGLDTEDTIAHYDTLDGKTEVTHSNRVCVYAPRFAAVRKISAPILYEAHQKMAGVEKSDKLNLHADTKIATTAIQPEALVLERGLNPPVIFREQTRGLGLDVVQLPVLARTGFLPYEDFLAIRRGQFEGHEKARLAERVAAAVVWETKQAVQVVIESILCVEAKNLSKVGETVVYELEGKPRLQIIKVADKSEAQPGEIVEFTLRFDNLGEQPVGNVTIMDNLTTRLEYVEGSASCTLKSEFKTQVNDGESLIVRWEIAEPLKVGEGGIIRFKCKVR